MQVGYNSFQSKNAHSQIRLARKCNILGNFLNFLLREKLYRHPAEKTPASVVAQFKLRKRGGRRATHGRHAEP